MGGIAEELELEGAAPPPARPLALELGLEGAAAPAAAEQLGGGGAELVPSRRPFVTPTESLIRGAGDAASMGFLDEAGGLGAWLASRIHGETPRTRGRGIHAPASSRSSYEVERDAQRTAQDDAYEANPGTFMLGEGLGTVLTAAAPMGKASVATKLIPRAKQAAKLGALSGGIGAAGASEASTPEGVAVDAALGAGAGFALAPAAGELVHQLGRAPGRLLAGARRILGKQAQDFQERTTAGYGPELAPRAQVLADPTSKEGKFARALARDGADPHVLEAQSHGVTRAVDELEGAAPRVPQDEHALALRGVDEEALEGHTRELQQRVTELWDKGDVVKWYEDIASKRPLVRKLLSKDGLDPATVIQSADDMIRDTRQAMHEMTAYVEKGTPDRSLLNKLEKEIAEYELAKKTQTVDLDGAANRFMAVDQVKREFQRALENVRARRDSPMIEQLDQLETSLREYLENPHVWGEGASALQQIRNRGWVDSLVIAKNTDANPRRLFLSDASGEKSMDPYRAKLIGDAPGLSSIVRSAGDFEATPKLFALREWSDREAGLLEALTTHIDADPDLVAGARRAKQLAREISEILDQRVEEASAAKRLGTAAKDRAAQDARDNSPRKVLFSDRGQGPVDPFLESIAADPTKLHGVLDQAGTFSGGVRERVLRDWAKRKAAELEQQAATNPALAEQAERARMVAHEIGQTLDARTAQGGAARELGEVAARDSQARELGEGMGSKVLQMPAVQRAAGAALSLPVAGAAVGAAFAEPPEQEYEQDEPSLGDAVAARAKGAAKGAALGLGARGAGKVVGRLAGKPGAVRELAQDGGELLRSLLKGSPKLGEQAKEIQALERTLELEPGNGAARRRLEELGKLSPTLARLLRGRGARAPELGAAGGAVEQLARVGAGRAAGESKATEQPRMVERAAALPMYSRAFDGQNAEEQAVTYARLVATDEEFRERMRELGEENDEDLEGEPFEPNE